MRRGSRWTGRICSARIAGFVAGILVFGGALGGCATVEQTTLATSALASGKSRIVLQRTNETLHGTTSATTKVNGKKVADVAAGATAVIDVTPGPLALSVESWSSPGQYSIPLEVRPGETVKVEIAPRQSTASAVLGPIGGLMDKDEKGNGGAFTVRQVANLDQLVPGASVPANTQ